MSKPTPGRWALYSPHRAEQYVDQVDSTGEHYKSIFRIHHDDTIPKEEAEANGRLIANARAMFNLIETVALGNTDADRLAELAKKLIVKIEEGGT